MISIRQWFVQNGKRPLVSTLLLIFGLIIFYDFRAYQDLAASQLKAMNEISSLVGVGLAQKNRLLIESILDNTHWLLRSKAVLLCHADTPVFRSGSASDSVPCSNSKSDFFSRLVSTNIPGFDGYSIKLNLPRFPEMSASILLGFTSLWILAMCLYLIARVQNRFSTDIIAPLSEGVLGGFENTPKKIHVIELENIRLAMIEATKLKVENAVNAAMVETSLQVSHDIRSPLSALNVAVSNMTGENADIQFLIKQAIERIRNISEDLLKRNRDRIPAKTEGNQNLAFSLARIVREVQSEISIPILLVQPEDRCLIGNELKFEDGNLFRIISNLAHNSVEASATLIKIEIKVTDRMLDILVKDDGRGIPEEELEKVGLRGFTSGKERGNGLGLSYSKSIVESWGGALTVASKVREGTVVVLRLPRLTFAET